MTFASGGAVCASCARLAFPGAIRVEAEVLAAASQLQSLMGLRLEPKLRAQVRSLVRRFTHHTLGRNPRSLEFLAQVGIEG